jgi:glutamate carboxypeptidase
LLQGDDQLAVLTLAVLLSASRSSGQQLSQREAAIVHSIDEEAPAAVMLLEKIVNINSGTFNPTGVVEVGKELESEFQTLGFTTHWVPIDEVQRTPSLVAERRGIRGKRLLLIGHMDTVFEPSSPFQKFVRNGDIATGPGTSDMKGGIVVILSALKALRSAGALEGARITVFLTGDEEAPGERIEISRKELIEAGKNSDAVLSYEAGISEQGKDYASTVRRGGTSWELLVHAKTAASYDQCPFSFDGRLRNERRCKPNPNERHDYGATSRDGSIPVVNSLCCQQPEDIKPARRESSINASQDRLEEIRSERAQLSRFDVY